MVGEKASGNGENVETPARLVRASITQVTNYTQQALQSLQAEGGLDEAK